MVRRSRTPAHDAWECVADLWLGGDMQTRFHDACASVDLSPPQLKTLLSLESDLPMRAIADMLHCDASWVTGIVDGLEERGYVVRQPHASDRRIKVVAITELGEKAKATAIARLHEPPTAMLDALTQNEQRTLRDLLRKVRDSQSSG